MESEGFAESHLNYLKGRMYYFNESIDRMIGTENAPAKLRVPPLFDA